MRRMQEVTPMKQICKQLAALLLAVALAAACAAPAFAAATAASIELTRKGSITVTLRDSESGSAVSGGKLTLYQVASISRQNGNLSYDYTNGFENCGVSLGDLSESDLAQTLDDKRPAGSKGETLTLDTDGKAVFSRLPLGLYLVVQSTASTGDEKINPFLVSVPLVEEDTYLYDVDALPKVGTLTPTTPPDVPGEPDKPEEPDKPTEPEKPTTPENPDKPETPDIPEEPGKNTPPGADNPDDWVLNGRPDKNKQAPGADNPEDWVLNGRPTLPQTGQLNWPIPVLTAAGTCLIAAGILLRKKH